MPSLGLRITQRPTACLPACLLLGTCCPASLGACTALHSGQSVLQPLACAGLVWKSSPHTAARRVDWRMSIKSPCIDGWVGNLACTIAQRTGLAGKVGVVSVTFLYLTSTVSAELLGFRAARETGFIRVRLWRAVSPKGKRGDCSGLVQITSRSHSDFLEERGTKTEGVLNIFLLMLHRHRHSLHYDRWREKRQTIKTAFTSICIGRFVNCLTCSASFAYKLQLSSRATISYITDPTPQPRSFAQRAHNIGYPDLKRAACSALEIWG